MRLGGDLASQQRRGYKNRKNKFKIRILKALHAVLNEILKDGRKVMRVGRQTAYSPAEIFLGNGIFTMMYRCYPIVCTNKRLLFMNINARITHPLVSSSRCYTRIQKKVKQGLLLNHLILYRMSGERCIFTSVSGIF
jgi:hypothetical protein